MNKNNVLLLPGWYDSGAAHWQSLWKPSTATCGSSSMIGSAHFAAIGKSS